MLASAEVEFDGRVERKAAGLPAFMVVPADVLAEPAETFMTECRVNGQGPWRRSIKPWGDGRWFLEFNADQARKAGFAAGDMVRVHLRPAPDWPDGLIRALQAEQLITAWEAQPKGARRMAAEHVFEARREATAEARIRTIVDRLKTAGRL